MNELIIYAGIVFMAFFAIMNPIASIPVFLTLTDDQDDEETQQTAFKALLTAFIIVLVFAVSGHLILQIFGISITALRITGGVIVAIIGYHMLQGLPSNVSKPSSDTINKSIKEDNDVALSPLATPLLAGPGVIITAMNFADHGIIKLIITIIAFGLLCFLTYFAFLSGKQIKKAIGTSALRVITRMMGLILAVIGVQMLILGIYSAINEFS